MMRLFAFMFIVFCIAVYTTDPVKTVLELVITIIGIVTGMYYTFFRDLDVW